MKKKKNRHYFTAADYLYAAELIALQSEHYSCIALTHAHKRLLAVFHFVR